MTSSFADAQVGQIHADFPRYARLQSERWTRPFQRRIRFSSSDVMLQQTNLWREMLFSEPRLSGRRLKLSPSSRHPVDGAGHLQQIVGGAAVSNISAAIAGHSSNSETSSSPANASRSLR